MEAEILEAYNISSLDPQRFEESNNKHTLDSDNVDLLEVINKDYTEELNIIDPLNPNLNIIGALDSQGIQDKLKFSINSKQFNSKLFLKTLHYQDSFDDLSNSIAILENSLSIKNQELKGLIEVNFNQFVKSKTSLDDILSGFRSKGFSSKEDALGSLNKNINESQRDLNLLIKPIVNNKEKEYKLKKSIEFISKNEFFFNLINNLKQHILVDNYDGLIHDYHKAKLIINDSTHSENKILRKIWAGVEALIDSYKEKIWQNLTKNDSDYLKSLTKLIELDSQDNPIIEWIYLKLEDFSKKFSEIFGKFHELLLNHQLNILSILDQNEYSLFRQVLLNKNFKIIDSNIIVEAYLILIKFFDNLIGLIENFKTFWEIVENFIKGDISISSTYINSDNPFLRFANYEIDDIKSKTEGFIDQLLNKVVKLFQSSQSSLKSLHSKTETSSSSSSANIENFGFLPPFTNIISTLKFLPLIYTKASKILNDLGQLAITDKSIRELRDSFSLVQERVIGAVCANWLNDCANFNQLEDFKVVNKGSDLPELILNFQTYIISKLGEEFFPKKLDDSKVSIIKYPSKKLLTGVQIQFLRSFDILLESLIKKIIQENDLDKHIKNFHKLITISNIIRLKTIIIPKTIQNYDLIFETRLSQQKLEIYDILNKMETTIFESYINEERKTLLNILNTEIDTDTHDKISSYIHKLLRSLINVHINASKISDVLIGKILTELVEFLSVNILKKLRELNYFNQQVYLDMEFLQRVLGKYLNDESKRNFKLIYRNLDRYDVSGLLRESLANSKIELEIFN